MTDGYIASLERRKVKLAKLRDSLRIRPKAKRPTSVQIERPVVVHAPERDEGHDAYRFSGQSFHCSSSLPSLNRKGSGSRLAADPPSPVIVRVMHTSPTDKKETLIDDGRVRMLYLLLFHLILALVSGDFLAALSPSTPTPTLETSGPNTGTAFVTHTATLRKCEKLNSLAPFKNACRCYENDDKSESIWIGCGSVASGASGYGTQ